MVVMTLQPMPKTGSILSNTIELPRNYSVSANAITLSTVMLKGATVGGARPLFVTSEVKKQSETIKASTLMLMS